jgi:hypothetical protein
VGDDAVPAITAERFQETTKDSLVKVSGLKENSHQPIVMAHTETQATMNAEKKTASHEPVREQVLTAKTEERVLLAEVETTMEESPDRVHKGDELETEEVVSGQKQGIPLMKKTEPITKITVNFENPEDYRDIEVSNRGPKQDQKMILPVIEKYLVKLGEKYLKEGQTLDITFTNIDLAGEKEPWHTPPMDNIRYMKSVYPPELSFKYTFSDSHTNQTVVGEESLIDLSYSVKIRRDDHDRIFYEKRMLRDWIRKLTSDKK